METNHPWDDRLCTSRSSAATRPRSGPTTASCSDGSSRWATPRPRRVSEPGNYGFVDGSTNGTINGGTINGGTINGGTINGGTINGGVVGGVGHAPRVLFSMDVPDLEAALAAAERLGGTRRMGPEVTPGTLVVGQFIDPEGNLIGGAGTR